MNVTENQNATLKYFAPHLEKFSTRSKMWAGFLLALIAFGMFGLYKQIVDGHGVTGMRDYVVWGVYIVNFVFFIGVSYAGAIVAGILHLLKVPWRRPIIRLAIMLAVISAIVGPFFIILCIGRFDRLYYLFIHARLQSPIIWDVLAITTYLVGAILFLYLTLIKDFAIYRDTKALNLPPWRRKVFKALALNYQDTEFQKKQVNVSKTLISIIMVPMVVIVSSVLSWIFGMTLRPGWHSSIFGPYFVLASILSGVGVLIMLMYAFRKIYKLEEYFTDKHFVYMGWAMLILAAAYGYVTFSEYLTSWYGSEEWDSRVIDKLFVKEYSTWSFFSTISVIVIPIVVVALKPLRTTNMITLAAFLVAGGMWVRRYLIVVPTLETPLLPIQDVRPEYVNYSATWVEWALTIGGLATFFLFFLLMAKFVTIFSISEYADKTKFAGIDINKKKKVKQ